MTHTLSVGEICTRLIDGNRPHALDPKDRAHLAKVIGMVYKFRSDRGAVHISPTYSANYMDSMLVLHAAKWIFAEVLRLALQQDRQSVAETIEQLVQLEHSHVHELDGTPLVLVKGIPAPDEVLLLLFNATGNRLGRAALRQYASHHKPGTLGMALTRLIEGRDIRPAGDDEVALTPKGQKRVLEQVIPRWTPKL